MYNHYTIYTLCTTSCYAYNRSSGELKSSLGVKRGEDHMVGGWVAGKELIIRLTQSSWAGVGTELGKNVP